MNNCLVMAASLMLGAGIAAAQTSELDFVTDLTEFHDVRGMLGRYMNQQALTLLDQRKLEVAKISSSADVQSRREYVRKHFLEALGGLPERTPLNAQRVGTLDRGDYRIEKIIFQSQPGFFVTANLYLPKTGSAPYPGILFPLGHEPGGKTYHDWQQMLGSLAKKGYVALTWDPLGQGERVQLWDADTQDAKLRNSTTEHTVMGAQCLLLGHSLARYTVWDGMRALDYLLSRPEVDPKRIACTGNSGGGTHTAYLSALDDRIQVAAPSCYLTSWRRLLTTIGPQDAEQNLPPWLMYRLDHADFVLSFAPKPYLILSAIRDFFSISGARGTYAEAKQVYANIGATDKISMFDADDGHGYLKPRRMAAYKWFARWLKGSEDNDPEPEIQLATVRELDCTETGQLSTSLGGETVYSLNRKRAAEMAGKRQPVKAAEVRRLIGFEAPARSPVPQPYGVIEKNGYRIEKLVYESEPGILLPAVVYVPAGNGRKSAVLIADGNGKSRSAREAEKLVASGAVVMLVDLRGLGETRSEAATKGGDWNRYFGDFDSAMTGLLIGRSLVGMRVLDLHNAVSILVGRNDVDPGRVSAIGRGLAAIPVLHAAALDDRIKRVALDDMLVSYMAVERSNINRDLYENLVQGALRTYDLPDLAKLVSPRNVLIVDAESPMGQTLKLDEVRSEYASAGAKIVSRRPDEARGDSYLELLK